MGPAYRKGPPSAPPKIVQKAPMFPGSGITEIVLSGKNATAAEMRTKLAETLAGGYIFNANVEGNKLSIGFAKSFINDTKVHHDDLRHPCKSSDTVLGFIGSEPNIEMAFEIPLSESKTWIVFVNRFIRLARFLIENGFPPNCNLMHGPRDLLEQMKDIKLYNYDDLPKTLGQLAAMPLVEG